MTTNLKKPLSKPYIRLPKLPELNEPEVLYLENGIPLYLFKDNNTLLLKLELHFNAGIINEQTPLQARFTSMLITEGTISKTAEQISDIFDFHGTLVSFEADWDKAVVSLMLLPEHYNEIVSLLGDIIDAPSFPERELDILKKNRLQKYYIDHQRVSVITLDYFMESLFGESHPFGKRVVEKNFMDINRDSLKKYHEMYYKKGLMRIAITGNISEEIINLTSLAFKEKALPENNRSKPEQISETNSPNGAKCSFIEKGDALQSSIRMGLKTININHSDYQGLKVVNTILGGYFGSRLMQNLREDKGYTYGIQSFLMNLGSYGVTGIVAEVSELSTEMALQEIKKEIINLSDKKIGNSEMKLVRSSMLGSLVRLFEKKFTATSAFLSVNQYGKNMDYYKEFEDTIRSISPHTIKELAQTYLKIEDYVVIVAGNTKGLECR